MQRQLEMNPPAQSGKGFLTTRPSGADDCRAVPSVAHSEVKGGVCAQPMVKLRRDASPRGLVAVVLATLLGACATPPPPKPAEPPPEPVKVIVPAPPPVVVTPPPEPAPVVVVTQAMNEDEEQALSLLAYLGQILSASMEDQKRELQNALQQFQKTKSDLSRVRLAALLMLPAAPFQDDAKALTLLEGGNAKSATPLRDLAAYLHGQVLERQRQVREEQKRADAIQQKLDNLKAIERSLLDRDRKARPAGAPGAQ